MPFLDVSDVLDDLDFNDSFTLIRRTESIDSKGRSIAIEWPDDSVRGVFTTASPTDLERLDDQQRMRRVMCLVTRTFVQGPSPGRQCDVVLWTGDRYLVADVQPYTRYGNGFVQAIITSDDASLVTLDDATDLTLMANVLELVIHNYIPDAVNP